MKNCFKDLSELDKIVEFNKLAGVFKAQTDEELYFQLTLIEEEYNELLNAYETGDRKEMLDASADIVVTAAGMIHRLGYNPSEAMSIVNRSNLSKFVDLENEDDVEASIRKYDDDERYSDVYVDERGAVWGTVVATGSKKILKGIQYKEPQWQQLDRGLT